MLKILQARLQQYVKCELPDVQSGFIKDRGTRDQIANISWIIEKARALDSVDHNKLWKNLKRDGNTRPPDLPLDKPVCRSGNNS